MKRVKKETLKTNENYKNEPLSICDKIWTNDYIVGLRVRKWAETYERVYSPIC